MIDQQPLSTPTFTRRFTLRRAPAAGALVWVGVAVVGLLVLVAMSAPWIAPYPPDAIDLSNVLAGPSSAHLLGTDEVGRDLLSRLIWGARSSLAGPLAVVAVSTGLGLAIGVLAGWCGGLIDGFASRVLDLLFSFPGLLLAILAAALFGAGIRAAVIALSVAYMPWIARSARAAALLERERPYIAGCRVQGMSGLAVCVRHLMPNIAPVVIAQAAINFGYVMVDLAAVSYLGLGVQPPSADWGLMISEGQATIISGAPEQALWASAMFVVAVIAFNVLADALANRISGGPR